MKRQKGKISLSNIIGICALIVSIIALYYTAKPVNTEFVTSETTAKFGKIIVYLPTNLNHLSDKIKMKFDEKGISVNIRNTSRDKKAYCANFVYAPDDHDESIKIAQESLNLLIPLVVNSGVKVEGPLQKNKRDGSTLSIDKINNAFIYLEKGAAENCIL